MKTEDKSVLDDVRSNLVIVPVSNTHIDVVQNIASYTLGCETEDIKYEFGDPRKFTGGEFCPKFVKQGEPTNPVGKNVYIIVPPGPFKEPEALITRAAFQAFSAKDNGAKSVTLVRLESTHARQDRNSREDKKATGEPNSSQAIARIDYAMGVDKVITFHAHTPRLEAIYALEYGLIPKELVSKDAPKNSKDWKIPQHVDLNNEKIQKKGQTVFKSISPHAILADYVRFHSWLAKSEKGKEYLENSGARLAIRAVDKGNRPFIDDFGNALFLDNLVRVYCDKARKSKNNPNEVEVAVLEVTKNLKSLEGMFEIYADDGADTFGTMLAALRWSDKGNVCIKTGKKYGSPEDRMVHFSHAWLGGSGYETIQDRIVKANIAREVTSTSSRPYIKTERIAKFAKICSVLDIDPLMGDVIITDALGKDVMTRYVNFGSLKEQHNFLSPLYGVDRTAMHFMNQNKTQADKSTYFCRE